MMSERAQVQLEWLLVGLGIVILATVVALIIKTTAQTAVDNAGTP